MLPKSKYPFLSRAQRRHPQRMVHAIHNDKSWGKPVSWLLAGLFIRAGITPRVDAEGAQV